MAAHVADLADAEVPEHVPREAVHAGSAGEVARVVRMIGRWAEPQVEVEAGGRLALGGQVAGTANLAVAPGVGRRKVADRAVANQFADAVEVRVGVPLHADLRRQLALLLHPVGPDDASFFHGDGQRLLAVHVQIAVQGPVGDEGVGVVSRANDHRVQVLLLEAFPPVDVGLGLGEPLEGIGKPLLVHITKGDHVLFGQRVIVGLAAAPDADQRDVELATRASSPRPGTAGQDGQSGSDGSGGLQKLATLHGRSSVLSSCFPRGFRPGPSMHQRGGRRVIIRLPRVVRA